MGGSGHELNRVDESDESGTNSEKEADAWHGGAGKGEWLRKWKQSIDYRGRWSVLRAVQRYCFLCSTEINKL